MKCGVDRVQVVELHVRQNDILLVADPQLIVGIPLPQIGQNINLR